MARQIDRKLLKEIKKHEEHNAPRETWYLEECVNWKKKHKEKLFLDKVELPKFLRPLHDK